VKTLFFFILQNVDSVSSAFVSPLLLCSYGMNRNRTVCRI